MLNMTPLRGLGLGLILIALVQSGIGLVARQQINVLKLSYLPHDCHVGDDPNTCPILRDNVEWYVALLWVLSALLLFLGVWLLLRPEASRTPDPSSRQLLSRIDRLSRRAQGDERFDILLQGLDEPERAVMRAAREQDGLKQSTLAIRTGLSKSKLSLVLSGLEKRGLVAKVAEGKTNRIHLKKPL